MPDRCGAGKFLRGLGLLLIDHVPWLPHRPIDGAILRSDVEFLLLGVSPKCSVNGHGRPKFHVAAPAIPLWWP